MGIFGRKRIKKVKKEDKRKFTPPVDVERILQQPAQSPDVPQRPMFDHAGLEKAPKFPPISKTYPIPTEPAKLSQIPTDFKGVSETPSFAPLFIKLTRYKQILNSMNYLKMSINLIKNQIAILNELERLRAENMKLLKSTANKVNQRLIKLDSEFMRPSGFIEEAPEIHVQELGSLETTITDLKEQIESLKQEVESLD